MTSEVTAPCGCVIIGMFSPCPKCGKVGLGFSNYDTTRNEAFCDCGWHSILESRCKHGTRAHYNETKA